MTASFIAPVLHRILKLKPHYSLTSWLSEWLSYSIHRLNLIVQGRHNTAMEDGLFKSSYEAQPLAETSGKVTNIGSPETLCPPPQMLAVCTPPSATISHEVKCVLTYLPIPGDLQQLFVLHDCTKKEGKI